MGVKTVIWLGSGSSETTVLLVRLCGYIIIIIIIIVIAITITIVVVIVIITIHSRYTSVIASDFLSRHSSPNNGLWEAKRVLLDGEDRPEKVGCRKKSCFLEFMCVDVARCCCSFPYPS